MFRILFAAILSTLVGAAFQPNQAFSNCTVTVQDSAELTARESRPEPKPETEPERAIRLFNEGKFDDAIALAKAIDASLGSFSSEEKWVLLIVDSQMATGDYSKALKTIDEAFKRFPNSIRIRYAGIEVCNFNNDVDRALQLFGEIGDLASKSAWRYRDPANQLVLGKCFLKAGADAKDVLDKFYTPVKKRYSKEPEVYRAIGELALEKHDYALAAENFSKVLELSPNDTNALGQLAIAFRQSDSEKTNEKVALALKVNPNHIECLLITADAQVSAEDYSDANATLDKILKVNPHQAEAWAYKAAIAHLENDPTKEGEYRDKALVNYKSNAKVDYLIGRELSEKYRFAEGEKYQRRAIIYDSEFLPAKMQLAHDLLRLGQELEGWKLADEVFDLDQYSVVAHNLVTLRDEISKFKTMERNGFVVRMDAAEAEIYGERVLDLLSRASETLVKKYDAELETPIFIEIFPRQQDFAIRTFGLPGGAGFLGVCFGRVITMNSPAAQGANLTSWESVLWHEFCHVVTLQKTKNKMPRWLSEGISVYEENLADPAWGDEISVKYREMILSDDLTPVSKLSGAFLRSKSPMHLQFAYYESSLVVEYLVEKYGMPKLLKVLEDLAFGTPINDALRRHVAPVEFLDKEFAKFAIARADELAPNANWEEPDIEKPTAESLAQFNKEYPNNLVALIAEGQALAANKQWDKAIGILEKVRELSPLSKEPFPILAQAYKETGEAEKAFETLEEYAKVEASSVELYTALLEMTSNNGDWAKVKKYARRLMALNPLLTAPHRYLSMAAEKTNDDRALIESLSVLAKMNPLDGADVHFRLGSALHRNNELALAKRQVIMALEKAPRYRDAHQLLLKIHQKQTEAKQSSAEPASKVEGDMFGLHDEAAEIPMPAEPKIKKDLP